MCNLVCINGCCDNKKSVLDNWFCRFIFVALNVYNIYDNTLGDNNNGVVLVKYSIEGKPYTIMKRSTKRSIYLQVLLFSASGIYTILWTNNETDDVCNGPIYTRVRAADLNTSMVVIMDHIAEVKTPEQMILGKETFIDAGTEWRVKWAQRGIGTFVFYSWLEYQEQYFPNQCYCVRCDITPVLYSSTLQEHIVCDDETTFQRTKRDYYYGVEPLQMGH